MYLTWESFESLSIDLKNEIINKIAKQTEEIIDYIQITRVQNQFIDDNINRLKEQIISITEQITITQNIIYISMAIGTIAVIIGIAILWNQRKIKKQLRELLEEKERKDQDKP